MHFTSLLSAGLMAASAVTASPAMAPSKSMRKRTGGDNKVVVYWGNTGAATGNIPLSDVCSNPDVDVVVLSFLTEFPEQSGGVPVLNFGNACGNTFASGLLHCNQIGAVIPTCQANGKEVFLSLGGAYPHNQAFESAATAANFADWVWNSFGSDFTTGNDRPFDTAVIDGIDLDIESDVSDDQKQAYFPDFITELRTKSSNSWKISAAPQCVVPDAHFNTYIQSSWFDYIFVQLYNTDGCSARDLVATPALSSNTFDKWVSGALSTTTGYANSDIKVFAGLPASTLGSTGTSSGERFYLTPSEVKTLVTSFYNSANFGGISLWDATYDEQNQICGHSYSYWVKKALTEVYAGNHSPFPSACPSSTSSSSIASSTSSAISSSTSSVVSTTSSAIYSSSSRVSSSSSIASSTSSQASSSSFSPSHSFYSSKASSSSAPPTTSKEITSSQASTSPHATPSSTFSFPSRGPYTNSSSSAPATRSSGPGNGGPRPSSSYDGGLPGGNGGSWPSSSSSSPADGGYWGHGKPTATKTSTSSYVDVCETGLTTKTHTWTKTCYEGDYDSTTTGVPDGWTVTVTVTAWYGKTTTVTLTKPIDTPAPAWAKPTDPSWPVGGDAKVTSTMVVVVTPVPEAEYWSYVGKPVPTTPVAPVSGSSSGSWSGAGANTGSSAIAKPVAGSPSNAASWPLGTGASSGSKTGGTYAAQFTGAASKMNVGVGLLGGLAVAALVF